MGVIRTSSKQYDPQDPTSQRGFNLRKLVRWAICVLVLLIIVSSCLVNVQYGHVGFRKTFGGLSDSAMEPGLKVKWPFIQDVIQVNVQIAKAESDASASSKDLQPVHSHIAVNYFINPNSAYKLLTQVGADYDTKVIDPHIQEAFKAVTAKYSAEELIAKRDTVATESTKALAVALASYDIQVKDISITNFGFSDAFNKSIEDKQVAAQKALQAQNTLQEATTTAQQKVEQAKADAQGAKATADATLYTAQKQAEANKVLATSITPELIQYNFVQQIKPGVLPQYWGVGGGSLFSIPNQSPATQK